jgi:hypothetical protein
VDGTPCCRNDRGQAIPLLVAVLAIGAVVLMAIGHLGERAVDGARARTAADAAALAGAADGRRAAVALAGANGGTLVGYSERAGGVTVTVRVGRATAVARAALVEANAGPPRTSVLPP